MASNENTDTSFAASTYSTSITTEESTEESTEDQKGRAEQVAIAELAKLNRQFDDIELEQRLSPSSLELDPTANVISC
jgi:hypothetical protein